MNLVRYQVVHCDDSDTVYNQMGKPSTYETYATLSEAAEHRTSAADYIVAVDGIVRELTNEERQQLMLVLR